MGKARRNMTTARDLQLQMKTLQFLHREIVLKHITPDDEILLDGFSRLHELCLHTDILLKGLDLEKSVTSVRLSGQLEYFRKAYLELLELYREDLDFPVINSRLFAILERRLSALPQEISVQVHPLLSALILVQVRIYHERQSSELTRLKDLKSEIASIVSDHKIEEELCRLILNTENNYINYLAIEDREQFLDTTSEQFIRVSSLAIEAISVEMDEKQQQMVMIIVSLLLANLVCTVFFWRLSSRYFLRFLQALEHSVASIRAGNFDYDPPLIDNDELGEQLLFVKEVSGNLKRSMAALADSERKFRSLVENISDWIWSVDNKGRMIYSNARVEQYLGYKAGEIMGWPLERFGCEYGPDSDPGLILEYIEAHEPLDGVIHAFCRQDGALVEFETSGTPVFSNGGVFQGFRFISRDISERLAAESELKKNSLSRKLFNQILGLSLEDLSREQLLDRFLQILVQCSWLGIESSGALFLMGSGGRTLELQAHVGLNISLLESCGRVPLGTCLCGRAAQTGKVVFASGLDERHELTYQGMHLHGHYCVPIHTVAGEVLGVFTLYIKEGSIRKPHVERVLTSVSTILGSVIGRKKAEEERQALNLELEKRVDVRTAQLAAANKELDTFAYSVSHDLRAPLRAIDGFSLALLEDYEDKLDEDGKGYLGRVRRGCLRMGNLIDDILQLSRLTRGEIRKQDLDLSAMAEKVFEELRHGTPERQVEVLVSPGLRVDGDAVMIRAVLDNLLGNSWKYSSKKDEARIEMGSFFKDGQQVIFIRDNGAGFDMQYSAKLFDAFKRLHSSAEFEGTGVGLATVQRIINRHGGSIWAESEVDKGATFFFII